MSTLGEAGCRKGISVGHTEHGLWKGRDLFGAAMVVRCLVHSWVIVLRILLLQMARCHPSLHPLFLYWHIESNIQSGKSPRLLPSTFHFKEVWVCRLKGWPGWCLRELVALAEDPVSVTSNPIAVYYHLWCQIQGAQCLLVISAGTEHTHDAHTHT